ncbi:uncharacterized protein [Rutidosis leptorrhynchoides]|uniref:uncharacterized protein isoform X3 n=1 Tax=Rutidosis leptorrhynchoides TaxID=125765 RepID=UPI003A9A21EA
MSSYLDGAILRLQPWRFMFSCLILKEQSHFFGGCFIDVAGSFLLVSYESTQKNYYSWVIGRHQCMLSTFTLIYRLSAFVYLALSATQVAKRAALRRCNNNSSISVPLDPNYVAYVNAVVKSRPVVQLPVMFVHRGVAPLYTLSASFDCSGVCCATVVLKLHIPLAFF